MHYTAPRRFEGNFATCGEHGHTPRFSVTTRGVEAVHSHANVDISSGEGSNAYIGGQEYVATAVEDTGGALAGAQ